MYVYNTSYTTTTLNWVNFVQFTKAYNIKQYNRLTFYGSFLRGPIENKFSADFRNTEIGILSYTSASDVSSVSFTITQIVSLKGIETFYMKTNKGTYINRIALS